MFVPLCSVLGREGADPALVPENQGGLRNVQGEDERPAEPSGRAAEGAGPGTGERQGAGQGDGLRGSENSATPAESREVGRLGKAPPLWVWPRAGRPGHPPSMAAGSRLGMSLPIPGRFLDSP